MRLQLLLYRKNGSVTGAMAPVLAAQLICKQEKFLFHGLVRIWFDSEEVNNRYEGPGKRECLTGCDTLMVLSRHQNLDQVFVFVDMGCSALPVALYFSDEKSITVTPIYKKYPFERKCTEDELKQIIEQALRENKFDIIET